MTLTISDEQLEALVDLVDGIEDDVTWRRDYSGRGMYGQSCIAANIDGTGPAFMFRLGVELGRKRDSADVELEDDLVEALISGVRSDSMGRRSVLYWPGIRAEGK